MASVIPETLLKAQQLALSRDQRIDTLNLDALKKGVPNLDIAGSIVSAKATLTIEGASTLEIGIEDSNWVMESSGLLDVGDDGRMLAVNVRVDGLTFRLCQATRKDPSVLTLTFEDEVVALMRTHNKYKAASRGSMTRAEFIRSLVAEIKAREILFFAPERGAKQPVKLPDFPDVVPAHGDTGFDQAATFKIKGQTADAAQMRQVATAMGVADQEGASPLAVLAMIVAGIGESSFRAVPNGGGSNYWGVFQGSKDVWKLGDTAGMARSFLRGGKGFQAGGAIAAHRANPDWSPGTIAYKVEGDRSNFASDAQAEHFYQQWHDEATKIASLWTSGQPTATDAQGKTIANDRVLRSKQYQFARGTIDKRENSWVCGQRLTDEVRWRLYAVGGVIWFVTDDWLISKPASLVLDGPYASGLLEPPSYDFDHGKLQHQVDLSAVANRWAVRPGEVVLLTHMGPIGGRWIVESVEIDLLDATDTKVTLIKPVAPLKEPSHEVATQGAPSAVGTSRSKLSSGLVYPLAKHGKDLGGVAAHQARAWGNWQSDNAVDIGVPIGTGVYAVADGTIAKLGGHWDGTGQSNPNGFNVTLTTKDNAWFYTHLKSRAADLKVGMQITAGHYFGASGAANGVQHLHIASEHGDPEALLGVKDS